MCNDKKKSFGWIVGTIIVASILGVWILTPFVLEAYIPDVNQRGLFGDSFGSINSLFSGLAFAGVIIAILLQRQELQLQREELKLTREELSRSASAQEDSGKSLGEQAQVMKITAHLNGLAAIIQAQSEQINYFASRDTYNTAEVEKLNAMNANRDKSIKELEELMHSVLSATEY